MNEMNPRAIAGGNSPPDPISEATAPYQDAIEEAQSWLDGAEVENEGQMKAVDALTKDIKAALKAVVDGQKSASAPLHDAWKAELETWKPTIADLTMIRDGLVSAVGKFKKALQAKRDEEQRIAAAAAAKARREAEEAARAASVSDIEAQREAAEKLRAAQDAAKAVKAVDVPKGMRTVHKFTVADHKAALHWIARNDRDAVTAFVDAYVQKNHRAAPIDGVKSWTEKEAF